MPYYVYAIKSKTKKYIYVGMTSDVTSRLERHNALRESTTKPYAPFSLIYVEKCISRPQARIREKYFKSGYGKEFLNNIFVDY